MVDFTVVSLPVGALPASASDEVAAAALRALQGSEPRPGVSGWGWRSARLTRPQIAALAACLEALPEAETITEREARRTALRLLARAQDALRK